MIIGKSTTEQGNPQRGGVTEDGLGGGNRGGELSITYPGYRPVAYDAISGG